MANNRMYLTNKVTGAEVLIAKYYPSTGWYVFYRDLVDRLDCIFDGNSTSASMWGDNDWELKYEVYGKTGASVSDTWFAWRPVRAGALGTGRWMWLRRVWRNRCMGVTIYQPLDEPAGE